jgi:hypothetical protein
MAMNRESQGDRWPEPRPRQRIGRGAVLAFVREEVGAGRGIPDAARVALRFGWLVSSARNALMGLAADGHLRVAGREPPRGKTIYELTAAGASARSKICSRCQARKPEAAFWPSSHTPDRHARYCKQCLAEIGKTTGRRRRRSLAAAAGRAP